MSPDTHDATPEAVADVLDNVAPILAPGGHVLVASVPPHPGADVWAFMDGKPPDYFFGGDAP